MNRRILGLGVLAGLAVSAGLVGASFVRGGPARSMEAAAAAPARGFEFRYTVQVPSPPAGTHRVRMWIPVPLSDGDQTISGLRIESPVRYRLRDDAKNHNRYAYLEWNAAKRAAPFQVVMNFHAVRREEKVSLDSADSPSSPAAFPRDVARFLEPDRLVPINGTIGQLSAEQTKGAEQPLERARRIYEYVVRTMHYDHDGTGWGRGDAIYACTAHHGNCTDFHSLFIGMARAAGIPAKFEIGFPLPLDQHAGVVKGYHCWAWFFIQGRGWVPIDASQAWQMPDKHEYFFGALDQNRVLFARGRDLVLNPRQAGDPVNYIVYPYAEADGKPFSGIGHEFSFQDDAAASTPAPAQLPPSKGQ